MTIETTWRGAVTNEGANLLHAEAFETRVFDAAEWNWERLVQSHSLGWVTARSADELLGFVNVIWGLAHAWIQDVMVTAPARRRGVGQERVRIAAQGPGRLAASGCTSTSTSTCGPSTLRPAASPRPTRASCACKGPLPVGKRHAVRPDADRRRLRRGDWGCMRSASEAVARCLRAADTSWGEGRVAVLAANRFR